MCMKFVLILNKQIIASTGRNEYSLSMNLPHNISYSFKKSVINMGIKLFNHLSTELKQLDDFNQFRKEVKKFLWNKPLYTLEEYFD